MYGHDFYTTMDEHINNVKYPCVVPAWVLPQSKLVDEGILEPMNIPSTDEAAMTSMTIADMIDVIDKGAYVQTKTDEDTIEIYMVVREYVDRLQSFTHIQDVKDFLVLITKFKEMLERPIRIITNTNEKLAHRLGTTTMSSLLKRYTDVTNK